MSDRGFGIVEEQEIEGTLWIIIGSLIGVSLSTLSPAKRLLIDFDGLPDYSEIYSASIFFIFLIIILEIFLFFFGFVVAGLSVVGAIIMAITKDVDRLAYCATLFWGLSVSLSIYHHGLWPAVKESFKKKTNRNE